MEARRVRRYKNQSAHYFANAIYFNEIGEVEKASEFLWGSLAQALKALAASRGIMLRSHNNIKEYALSLAKELKDNSIRYAFDKAQLRHSNFYESGLTQEDVAVGAEGIKAVVNKLLSLVPETG